MPRLRDRVPRSIAECVRGAGRSRPALAAAVSAAPPPVAAPAIPPPPLHRAPAPSIADAPETSSEPLFLYIPQSRLLWMHVVTMGLYEAYWMYRNWRFLKRRYTMSISPFWRSVFGVLFIYLLFDAIKSDPQLRRILPARFSVNLAIGWQLTVLFARGLLYNAHSPALLVLGAVLSVLAVFYMVPVQSYINEANDSLPSPPAYSPWTVGQILLVPVGLAVWAGTALAIAQAAGLVVR